MLKKLIITSIVLAMSGNAFAGAYVGASIGANYALFKDQPANYGTARFGDVGPMFDLFAGYGKLIKENLYLGGEVFVSGISSDVDGVTTDYSSHDLDTHYSYGMSVIPGVMISQNTMAYARLGVVRTGFEVKSSAGNYEESSKETSTGGQAGLGLQTALTPNLDLRGEYDFTSYKSFTTGDDDKITPTSGQVKLGLVYKFN